MILAAKAIKVMILAAKAMNMRCSGCCRWQLIFIVRPIFKLRISKFGVWVNQILKRRRWIFLMHRLIS